MTSAFRIDRQQSGTRSRCRRGQVGRDASGKFFLTGIAPGSRQIQTSKTTFSGPGGYVTDTRTVDVVAGSNPPLSIALAALGTVTLTITDSVTGNPIQFASASIDSGVSQLSDTGGHVTFSNVNPGSHTLTVTATGYTTDTRSITVASGSNAVAVVLVSTTGTLTGTVTDATNSQPIQGATVSVGGTFPSTQTDAAGKFTLAGVAPGARQIQTSKTVFVGPGGYVTDSRAVTVIAGGNPPLAIALAPIGAVTVTVTDATTHNPIASANVSIDGGFPIFTGSDGKATIFNVSPGSHSLQVSHVSHTTDTRTITVVSGPNSVSVDLGP